jgi:hypothetical protein
MRIASTGAAGAVLAAVVLAVGAGSLAAVVLAVEAGNAPARGRRVVLFPQGIRTLDGSDNNRRHPTWGKADTPYLRVAPANYADGIGAPVGGPEPRTVSNRVFNDLGQNIFSENGVTQWGFVWAQLLDHTFGLRQEGGENAPIPFDQADPLEAFTNDLGSIAFARSKAAAGTGAGSPRQQVNTVSSYTDAWSVYGGTAARLEWLRAGPVDGNLANNSARLLTGPDDYLPRADARGNAAAAPKMDLVGRLAGSPEAAVVAGDVRANENVALTAVHTLFVREHNRIVDSLPDSLAEETKFQIARRIVGAQLQYITYTEFLPALGVELAPYRGYKPRVDASLSNEFATVGYRGHSMIHGSIEARAADGTYTAAELEALAAKGIDVAEDEDGVGLEIPLNVAFANPDLLSEAGLGPILAGLGSEREYRNDEQIDNSLRSVLFQIPRQGTADPASCLNGTKLQDCFTTVLDLGAIDIQRARDHGIPSYNDLRRAYGLDRRDTFAAVTGEESEDFPEDPALDAGNAANDRDGLDFVQLLDADGKPVEPGTEEADEGVITAVRRTPLAARLEALYRSVDKLDAFVGMLSEPHAEGSELGELQGAIWKRQFEALRDGDRFFYLNDPSLATIRRLFGIDYRRTLAELIALNTDVDASDLQPDVFKVADGD